ncbi:MAG: hypothetical protein JW931_07265 [Methanomicrobiaceae archaeon]|nr:hypothetical protein [Methanomicrobiaceae archaeon]
MKTILKTDDGPTGVIVVYLSGDKSESRLFSYENLIDLNINVSDLLSHPDYYGMTDDGLKIVRTDFCKPELHENVD